MNRTYLNLLDELKVSEDGIVLKGEQFVPPLALRKKLIDIAHEGHLGQTRTAQRLKANWWWPSMDEEVRLRVEQCTACFHSEKRLKPNVGKIEGHIVNPGKPWDTICLDFIGPMLLHMICALH